MNALSSKRSDRQFLAGVAAEDSEPQIPELSPADFELISCNLNDPQVLKALAA